MAKADTIDEQTCDDTVSAQELARLTKQTDVIHVKFAFIKYMQAIKVNKDIENISQKIHTSITNSKIAKYLQQLDKSVFQLHDVSYYTYYFFITLYTHQFTSTTIKYVKIILNNFYKPVTDIIKDIRGTNN